MNSGSQGMLGTQIFVHLGKLPLYARHYASLAAANMPGYRTVLIVDRDVHTPIRDVEILRSQDLIGEEFAASLADSLNRIQVDPTWRKGYWLNVFLRYALIEAFVAKENPSGNAIHLESDVLSALTPSLVEAQLETVRDQCLVPFVEVDKAGPGIMLARTGKSLSRACSFTLSALREGLTSSDMVALAKASDAGLVYPLPTAASAPPTSVATIQVQDEGDALVAYDAAAVGQYLFGIDPRNNGGVLVAGYRERRGGIDPGEWRNWGLAMCSDGVVRVRCLIESQVVVFANIHMHSKALVPQPTHGDSIWTHALNVANGLEGAQAHVEFSQAAQAWFRRKLRNR